MRVNRLLCLILFVLAIPATMIAELNISITIAPPELVAYSQPSCPHRGYLWTPGYWAYGTEGYYWVPGTWVEPPSEGLLWTPGYWSWVHSGYVWNPGYWGRTVGFYGGIDYGYGYSGVGYEGGFWNAGDFYYNRSVNNVDAAIVQNTYARTVSSPRTGNYVSYNGGPRGTSARPTTAQIAAARGRHPATSIQAEHQQAASRNREFLASVNHGRPSIPATSRPGEFTGKGIAAARAAATEANSPQKRVVAPRRPENTLTQKKTAANRPVENRAATERAAANHPAVTTRSTENRATTERAAESRTSEKRATNATRPTEDRAKTERAAANHPAESRTSEKRPTNATRPNENKATTEMAAANHPAESRASETRAPTRPAENKISTGRAAPTHASENKAPEKPASAARSNDTRMARAKPEATQQRKAPSPQARVESTPVKKSPGGEEQRRP